MRGLAPSSSPTPSRPLKPWHQLIKRSLGAPGNKGPERQCCPGKARGPGEAGAPCQAAVAKLQTGAERWSREVAGSARWQVAGGRLFQ